ncbi:hypothetical protein [uncultured Dialister sp.]|uniref:hypothetical protein n=1 Tax=uncultured Dialister sp. TaxID=278064 RepID=UPI00262C5A6A|nr:hypothetical protein [uncultured Dialister sp.]
MKKIIAILTAFFLLLAAAPSQADYTEWKDSTYDFSKHSSIYMGEMDTSAIDDISPAGEWKLKEILYRKLSKVKSPALIISNPKPRGSLESTEKTEDAIIQNRDTAIPQKAIASGAAIYIQPRLTAWQVDSYLVPAHTEWRETEVRDAWRDKDGNWHEYYRTVTYPEYVPNHWVPYAEVTVTFEWYDTKTGNLIASSEDSRTRGAESSPENLYGRIIDRFIKNMKKTVG